MCGRFTQKSERPDIQLEFYIKGWDNDPGISYNVAPSQKAGVIINNGTENRYALFQWGLIPHWAKDPKIGCKMINAKAETITQKPSFKLPFKNKRCLIPAEGFYEWKTNNGNKSPYFIFLKDNPIFSMAGLFDEWLTPKKEKLFTFTIITTEANELVATLHEMKRMPVIIGKENRDLWLNNNEYSEPDLTNLLKPFESNLMDAYGISTFVNSPDNNSRQCIQPVNT